MKLPELPELPDWVVILSIVLLIAEMVAALILYPNFANPVNIAAGGNFL